MFASNSLVHTQLELHRAQRTLRHLRARLGNTSIRGIDFALLDEISDAVGRVADARKTLRKIDPTFTE